MMTSPISQTYSINTLLIERIGQIGPIGLFDRLNPSTSHEELIQIIE